MKSLRLFMIPFAATLFTAACDRGAQYEAMEPEASYGQVSDSIANTVCTHQQRCGEIEPDEFSECVGDVTEMTVDELASDACEAGFRQAQLNSCLSAVNARACGEEIEIDELDACSADVLCEI